MRVCMAIWLGQGLLWVNLPFVALFVVNIIACFSLMCCTSVQRGPIESRKSARCCAFLSMVKGRISMTHVNGYAKDRGISFPILQASNGCKLVEFM